MTYHIVDRKANDLSRTFSFAVTIVVAACGFFYVCTLSAPFAVCASSTPSVSAFTSASASMSASIVSRSLALSASSVACLLSVPRPLHLRLLCPC